MIIGLMILFGLCAGSFVNAFVWRLHEKKNWINGRSECTSCHHQLKTIDLIPVFSWILLKGKCRYCESKISIQYPLVELLVALVFSVCYVFWPVELRGQQIAVFALWLVILTGLVSLAVYDIKWMILPTKIIYFLQLLALAVALITIISSAHVTNDVINYVLGVAVGGGIFYCLLLLSKGKWIGGGDVRLGFLLGLLATTPLRSFLFIFIASLIGSVIATVFLAQKKLKKTSIIPFGPFLIAGLFIVQLAGNNIVHLYTRLFLNN